MRLQLVALVAGLAGVGISIYLTVVHYTTIPLACPANAVINCEQVLTSQYAVIAGSSLPTSSAGIVWFAVSAGLAFGLLRRPSQRLASAQLAWSAVGLVTALYLVYVEIVQLGAVCVWCSAAHVLVLMIFLIALPRRRVG
ncbi:MAG TPA: vitamin K epoxide reductase family protein [Candidatus Dormibacteraeota bacterium]|nr:vitamin K epoxide reductase family protein [Candidatus Dormibacteraeota bacterium]